MNLTHCNDLNLEYRKHSFYTFTDKIFKIIQFYDDRERGYHRDPVTFHTYDEKLDASISRSKKVCLEYALCNPWDYFCSLTISSYRDRYDLVSWRKEFTQWIRDKRKTGVDIKYLLVPEKHVDGHWHLHGFLRGIPFDETESFRHMKDRGCNVPWKLVRSNYRNWTPYGDKFGYCSIGKIKDPLACSFYILKYITKDKARMVSDLNANLYYNSQGLHKAELLTEFFGRSPEVDSLLTSKHEFCATGFIKPKHDINWTDIIDLAHYFEPLSYDALDCSSDDAEAEAEAFYSMEQLSYWR